MTLQYNRMKMHLFFITKKNKQSSTNLNNDQNRKRF